VKSLLTPCFALFSLIGTAQEIIDTVAWVTVHDSRFMPDEHGERLSMSLELNALFASHGVTAYLQPMAFARTKRLRERCEIRGTGDLAPLFQAMTQQFPGVFNEFLKHQTAGEEIALYDPPDNMWQVTVGDPNNWLWHLKKTQCDLAWDITRSDPSIRVGIMDGKIDGTHPDIQSKLVLPYGCIHPVLSVHLHRS